MYASHTFFSLFFKCTKELVVYFQIFLTLILPAVTMALWVTFPLLVPLATLRGQDLQDSCVLE